MRVREFLKNEGHRLEHVVEALQRIIPLAEENAVPLHLGDVPLSPVEWGAQRLVHRVIDRLFVDLLRRLAVKGRPARDVRREL